MQHERLSVDEEILGLQLIAVGLSRNKTARRAAVSRKSPCADEVGVVYTGVHRQRIVHDDAVAEVGVNLHLEVARILSLNLLLLLQLRIGRGVHSDRGNLVVRVTHQVLRVKRCVHANHGSGSGLRRDVQQVLRGQRAGRAEKALEHVDKNGLLSLKPPVRDHVHDCRHRVRSALHACKVGRAPRLLSDQERSALVSRLHAVRSERVLAENLIVSGERLVERHRDHVAAQRRAINHLRNPRIGGRGAGLHKRGLLRGSLVHIGGEVLRHNYHICKLRNCHYLISLR